jgi:hypothetical protein
MAFPKSSLGRLAAMLIIGFSVKKMYDFTASDVAEVPVEDAFANMTPARRFIEETIRSSPITVFSKSYCPHSQRAKSILSKYTSDYRAIEVGCRRMPLFNVVMLALLLAPTVAFQ